MARALVGLATKGEQMRGIDIQDGLTVVIGSREPHLPLFAAPCTRGNENDDDNCEGGGAGIGETSNKAEATNLPCCPILGRRGSQILTYADPPAKMLSLFAAPCAHGNKNGGNNREGGGAGIDEVSNKS